MSRRSRPAASTPDLGWRDDGLFTMFIANTKAGEDAWRVLAAHTEGTGKVLSHHARDTIRQLRAAGYTVAKLPASRSRGQDDDTLLAELLGTAQPPQP
ncbi:MAG: hypothetical protein QM740_20080 [Acidovorax sp.]